MTAGNQVRGFTVPLTVEPNALPRSLSTVYLAVRTSLCGAGLGSTFRGWVARVHAGTLGKGGKPGGKWVSIVCSIGDESDAGRVNGQGDEEKPSACALGVTHSAPAH